MFLTRNPNSLYQNVSLELGNSMRMENPSSKTRNAILLLVEKIEEIEEKVNKLKNNNTKIPIVDKIEKNFEWHVERYVLTLTDVQSHFREHYVRFILGKSYNRISFEIKIGLLKYICDSVKDKTYSMQFAILIQDIATGKINKNERLSSITEDVLKICPIDFLNSIFE